MSKQLVEALKEFIRTFVGGEILTLGEVIGVISMGINKELGTFGIQWNVAMAWLAVGTLANLKVGLTSAIDKWLHESDIKTPMDLKSLDTLIGSKK